MNFLNRLTVLCVTHERAEVMSMTGREVLHSRTFDTREQARRSRPCLHRGFLHPPLESSRLARLIIACVNHSLKCWQDHAVRTHQAFSAQRVVRR